jgi:hypothetical protein
MRSMLAVVRMPLMACLIATLTLLGTVRAQTTISPPTGQKSLAATLNVYAFPGAGQVPTQQAQDETGGTSSRLLAAGELHFERVRNGESRR